MSITRAQVALVISMYMVGLLIGSFGCGWLGDKIGEKDTVKDSFVRQKEDADVGSYNLLRVLISWSLHAGIRLLHGHQVPRTDLRPCARLVTAIGAQGIFQMVFAMSVEITGIK